MEVDFKIAPENRIRKKPSYVKPWMGLKYLFKKPVTIKIPYEKTEVAKRYRGVHTLDWKKCVGCNFCGQICPARAIEMTWIEKDGKMEKRPHPKIDYGRCTFCQFCVDVCPTGALGFIETFMITTTGEEEELQLYDWVPIHPDEFRKYQDEYGDYRFPVEKIEFDKESREVTYHLRDGTIFKFKILGYGIRPPKKPTPAKPAAKEEKKASKPADGKAPAEKEKK